MILGGAVAGQGETSIVITIAVVWFCAWAGDTTSFFIGSRLGRDFVLRHGRKVLITPERFEQVEKFFDRHGGKTILIGRFIGLVRALAPFIAGSSGMQYRAFVPYSVLGTGLWAAAFSLLGYLLANSLDKATEIAGTGALIFGSLVAVIVGDVRDLALPAQRREPQQAGSSGSRTTPGLRRLLPQLRFTWRRLTPGGLGLEFTTVMAVLSVSLFVLIGYGLIVSDDAGPTPGDAEAIDVIDSLRTAWLTDAAKVVTALGSTAALVPLTRDRGRGPRLAAAVAGARGAGRRRRDHADLGPGPEGDHRSPAAGRRPRRGQGASYPSGHAAHSVFYAWLALTIAVRVRPGWSYGTA